MADITLNSAVRSNLRSLQSTTTLMNTTEQRLSSGKKVNSALDNPSNFFTSQALDRRSSDLSNLLDSVANSVQTLKAADNGITAISDLVNQMKSTARTAQQSTSAVASRASFSSSAITGATADNLLGDNSAVATVKGTVVNNNLGTPAPITAATALKSAATSDTLAASPTAGDTLNVNGKSIKFYADAAAITAAPAGDADYQINIDTGTIGDVLTAIGNASGSAAAIGLSGDAGKIIVTNGAKKDDLVIGGTAGLLTKLGLTAATTKPTPSLLNDKTLTVKVGNLDAKTIKFGQDAGEISTLEDLNAALKDAGASASIDDTTGKLKISTSNAYEGDSLTVSGSSVSTDGSPASGEVFDIASTTAATTQAVFDDTDKKSRNNYKNDYNDLLGKISDLAKDASYNGINLLAGDDLKVTFNEDGSSSLDIGGTDVLDTLGLKTLSGDEFLDSSSLDKVVDSLNTALSNLDGLSSKFGSQLSVVQTRQDFTKNMIGTLDDGSNNLTAADTNEEAANLATLQTRQSLIVSSLSISTSQEQNILQLLR